MKNTILTICFLCLYFISSAQSDAEKVDIEIPRHEVGLDISFFTQMFSAYTYFENSDNVSPGLGAMEVFYKNHRKGYAWRGSLAYRELDDVLPYRFYLAKGGAEAKLYNTSFTSISIGADLLAGMITTNNNRFSQMPIQGFMSDFTAGVAPFVSIDFKTGDKKNIGFGLQAGPEFVYLPKEFQPYPTSSSRRSFIVVPFSFLSRVYLSYGF